MLSASTTAPDRAVTSAPKGAACTNTALVEPVCGSISPQEFIRRLVEAARDLRNRVATATFPDRRLATCTAQEFIIHIALDRLEDDLAQIRHGIHFDGFHKVFPKTRYDDDVGLYRDALLDDRDVELLFDPALDGVESDQLIALQLNPVHLHPTEWLPPSYPERTDEHLASRRSAAGLPDRQQGRKPRGSASTYFTAFATRAKGCWHAPGCGALTRNGVAGILAWLVVTCR